MVLRTAGGSLIDENSISPQADSMLSDTVFTHPNPLMWGSIRPPKGWQTWSYSDYTMELSAPGGAKLRITRLPMGSCDVGQPLSMRRQVAERLRRRFPGTVVTVESTTAFGKPATALHLVLPSGDVRDQIRYADRSDLVTIEYRADSSNYHRLLPLVKVSLLTLNCGRAVQRVRLARMYLAMGCSTWAAAEVAQGLRDAPSDSELQQLARASNRIDTTATQGDRVPDRRRPPLENLVSGVIDALIAPLRQLTVSCDRSRRYEPTQMLGQRWSTRGFWYRCGVVMGFALILLIVGGWGVYRRNRR
ncbi:MAG: hypothetical protein NTX53_08440 [candidate division WOR-3 bacterium]|nr:hypothetical protein [candidate division WOR-3 bacterium]